MFSAHDVIQGLEWVSDSDATRLKHCGSNPVYPPFIPVWKEREEIGG